MPRSAKRNLLKRFFSVLGPGLVTGAADNDPSGIATYSIVGAQLGMSLLWTAFVTWPLMGFVQLMCARIGMVTGRGLAGGLRQICPRWLLFIAAAALFGANVVTIGADLAGMSDAGQMLTGINSHFLTIFFGLGIALATIYFRYYQIAFILKWLTLVLFAWKQGLDKPVRSARYFYGVISLSTLLGIAMVFVRINPIKALFAASVINGVLA